MAINVTPIPNLDPDINALRRKVERGHVAGGMVYGYRNVRGEGHVTRSIVEGEAEVLRRIFREVAAGAGYLKVAQSLNGAGIPGPQPRTKMPSRRTSLRSPRIKKCTSLPACASFPP